MAPIAWAALPRSADIQAVIWQKFILNIAINPICAATGLRLGELARLPATDALQDRILDEALAVVAAKGLVLPDPDIRATVKRHSWSKFSKPSMLQHIERGRRTEIDALNGALVREAAVLAVQVNGKLRATIEVSVNAGRETVEALALAEPNVQKFMEGLSVRKVIVVPGKIVNIVAG